MAEMTSAQVRAMTYHQIVARLRTAARFEREHIAITWENGTDLVNIVAIHGDKLARALEMWDEPCPEIEAITGGGYDPLRP